MIPQKGRVSLSHSSLQSSLAKLHTEIAKEKPINEKLNPESVLQEELTKSFDSDKLKEEFMNGSLLLQRKETNRNINDIVYALRKLPYFEHYRTFNGIKTETVYLMAYFLKYQKSFKNTYIFKQGDRKNTRFYGMIKGSISIRTKKTLMKKIETAVKESMKGDTRNLAPVNLFKTLEPLKTLQPDHKKKNEPERIEVEKSVIPSGMCFGEWALIYNISRSASMYCLEDTELFYLDKDIFQMILSKDIIYSDIAKKSFIQTTIPNFKQCGNKVQDLLSMMFPMYYHKNQIVYSEFDQANFLYIVYQGECTLTKNFNYDNLEELKNNVEKLIPLIKYDKGALVGLEIVLPDSKYKGTLISHHNTVVYKISKARVMESRFRLEPFLKSLYHKQESNRLSALDKILKRKETIKMRKNNQIKDSIKKCILTRNHEQTAITLNKYATEIAEKVLYDLNHKICEDEFRDTVRLHSKEIHSFRNYNKKHTKVIRKHFDFKNSYLSNKILENQTTTTFINQSNNNKKLQESLSEAHYTLPKKPIAFTRLTKTHKKRGWSSTVDLIGFFAKAFENVESHREKKIAVYNSGDFSLPFLTSKIEDKDLKEQFS